MSSYPAALQFFDSEPFKNRDKEIHAPDLVVLRIWLGIRWEAKTKERMATAVAPAHTLLYTFSSFYYVLASAMASRSIPSGASVSQHCSNRIVDHQTGSAVILGF